MPAATHKDLVDIARRWLGRSAAVVVTEMSSHGSEEADAISFRADGHTVLIECKATRADFLADRRKVVRAYQEMGMGAERYYLTNPGVCNLAELRSGWGLLVWDGKRVRRERDSTHFVSRAYAREIGLLVSALRRLGVPERDGVAVRCYEIRSAQQPRATLGVRAEEEQA